MNHVNFKCQQQSVIMCTVKKNPFIVEFPFNCFSFVLASGRHTESGASQIEVQPYSQNCRLFLSNWSLQAWSKGKSNKVTVVLHFCRGVVCSLLRRRGFQSVAFTSIRMIRKATVHLHWHSEQGCGCVLIGTHLVCMYLYAYTFKVCLTLMTAEVW